jgi:hypothetical protein
LPNLKKGLQYAFADWRDAEEADVILLYLNEVIFERKKRRDTPEPKIVCADESGMRQSCHL